MYLHARIFNINSISLDVLEYFIARETLNTRYVL